MTLFISLQDDRFQLFKVILPDSVIVYRESSFSISDYHCITADFIITELSNITDLDNCLHYPHEKMIVLGCKNDNINTVTSLIQKSVKYFPENYQFKDVYHYIVQHYHFYKSRYDDVPQLSNLIGSSKCMESIAWEIQQYGPTNETVTILGESGTGKELVAMALHDHHCNKGSFITKNCSSIPDPLLESELFGTVKGAYTDSINRVGLIEQAHEGTLFLDEIGDMTLPMQSKLLRAIETKIVTPLGCSQSRKIQTRIITATSKNLKKMVQDGSFRIDLYHRINTLMIDIPPLRNRKEDIPHLLNFFMKKQKIQKKISRKAMEKLLEYNWPGNIRELKATITRASIRSSLEKEIKDSHIIFY